MLNKEKILMYLSIALLYFATVVCEPPGFSIFRFHDFQEGLTNWKCIVDGKSEQETKYSYNEKDELISIDFLKEGNPYFVSSYLEYVTVKDSIGKEVKFRYCSKRLGYNDKTHLKDWEELTTIVVIKNRPRIKTMVTTDGTGSLKYRDEYEYDLEGRKITAVRTHKDNKQVKYEYTYDSGKKLGIVSEEYYFETPQVYYNLRQYLGWCTLASQNIPIENVSAPVYAR